MMVTLRPGLSVDTRLAPTLGPGTDFSQLYALQSADGTPVDLTGLIVYGAVVRTAPFMETVEPTPLPVVGAASDGVVRFDVAYEDLVRDEDTTARRAYSVLLYTEPPGAPSGSPTYYSGGGRAAPHQFTIISEGARPSDLALRKAQQAEQARDAAVLISAQLEEKAGAADVAAAEAQSQAQAAQQQAEAAETSAQQAGAAEGNIAALVSTASFSLPSHATKAAAHAALAVGAHYILLGEDAPGTVQKIAAGPASVFHGVAFSVAAPSVPSLRLRRGGAGATCDLAQISMDAPGKGAGAYVWSASDPYGRGDDGVLAVAASGGGYWIRQGADVVYASWFLPQITADPEVNRAGLQRAFDAAAGRELVIDLVGECEVGLNPGWETGLNITAENWASIEVDPLVNTGCLFFDSDSLINSSKRFKIKAKAGCFEVTKHGVTRRFAWPVVAPRYKRPTAPYGTPANVGAGVYPRVANVYVGGLVVDGNRANNPRVSEHTPCFDGRAVKALALVGCEFHGSKGDGLYLGCRAYAYHPYASEDVFVKDIRITNCRRNGISMVGVRRVLVEDFVITDCHMTNIDIEPEPWAPSEGIVIRKGVLRRAGRWNLCLAMNVQPPLLQSQTATVALNPIPAGEPQTSWVVGDGSAWPYFYPAAGYSYGGDGRFTPTSVNDPATPVAQRVYYPMGDTQARRDAIMQYFRWMQPERIVVEDVEIDTTYSHVYGLGEGENHPTDHTVGITHDLTAGQPNAGYSIFCNNVRGGVVLSRVHTRNAARQEVFVSPESNLYASGCTFDDGGAARTYASASPLISVQGYAEFTDSVARVSRWSAYPVEVSGDESPMYDDRYRRARGLSWRGGAIFALGYDLTKSGAEKAKGSALRLGGVSPVYGAPPSADFAPSTRRVRFEGVYIEGMGGKTVSDGLGGTHTFTAEDGSAFAVGISGAHATQRSLPLEIVSCRVQGIKRLLMYSTYAGSIDLDEATTWDPLGILFAQRVTSYDISTASPALGHRLVLPFSGTVPTPSPAEMAAGAVHTYDVLVPGAAIGSAVVVESTAGLPAGFALTGRVVAVETDGNNIVQGRVRVTLKNDSGAPASPGAHAIRGLVRRMRA